MSPLKLSATMMGPVESSRTWEAISCIFYIPEKKALNICGYQAFLGLKKILGNILDSPWASLFRAAKAFRVTWCKRRCDVFRPFASDTSPNWIDREGLGKRRRGTRQGNGYICSFEQLFTSKNNFVRYSYPHARFTRGGGNKGRGGRGGSGVGKGKCYRTADRWTV